MTMVKLFKKKITGDNWSLATVLNNGKLELIKSKNDHLFDMLLPNIIHATKRA